MTRDQRALLRQLEDAAWRLLRHDTQDFALGYAYSLPRIEHLLALVVQLRKVRWLLAQPPGRRR